MKKLIVILGPTASGKSALAIKIAKKFGGEIVSADSRQVYKGMSIGTGKVSRDKTPPKSHRHYHCHCYFYKGIPHYLLDVTSPKRRFTIVQYRKLALKAIEKILKKGKIPILCGGTGFYIQAVVDGLIFPEVPPDWKLRKKLEKKSVKELYQILKKLDSQRAKTIEKRNPRRLIRAIEIITKTKKPIPLLKKNPIPYPVLMIGIKKEKKELSSLIRRRLLKRLRKGMIAEVKKLRKSGISWKRLEEFGLEYRFIAKYLRGKINYQEMVESIQKESEHFAKRQMTWFKRHPAPEQVRCGASKRIKWVKNERKVKKLVKEFLTKN